MSLIHYPGLSITPNLNLNPNLPVAKMHNTDQPLGPTQTLDQVNSR